METGFGIGGARSWNSRNPLGQTEHESPVLATWHQELTSVWCTCSFETVYLEVSYFISLPLLLNPVRSYLLSDLFVLNMLQDLQDFVIYLNFVYVGLDTWTPGSPTSACADPWGWRWLLEVVSGLPCFTPSVTVEGTILLCRAKEFLFWHCNLRKVLKFFHCCKCQQHLAERALRFQAKTWTVGNSICYRQESKDVFLSLWKIQLHSYESLSLRKTKTKS